MPGYELIGNEELLELNKLINSGPFLMRHAGPQDKYSPCKLAEAFFTNYIGSEDALLVSSGTTAIRVALQAINAKPGDYVLTQPFTFIATYEAILDIGCIPVAIPLDETLGMSSNFLKEFLLENKDKTSAIMPVHMLGEACDIKEICKIGEEYNIPVIEDNCEALGGSFGHKMLGNWGTLGTYSFDYGKIITSGEGGLITGSKDHIFSAYKFHDHGHTKNCLNRANELSKTQSLNFRYSELQAAVLLAQMKKLENILSENKKRYLCLSNVLKNFQRPIFRDCVPSYDTFMVKTDNKTDEVIKILERNNISTKNIPIAMNWHCSFYWDHLDFLDYKNASEESIKNLSKFVAIGIELNKSEDSYIELAKEIKSLMG